LSMLVNTLGTGDDFSTDRHILFIEEVDEYLYRIDRMFVQLKRSGKLENLSALMIGHFTQVKDNDEPFGSGVEEIILDQVDGYNYPVCFGAPFGHCMPNFPIILGRNFRLEVNQKAAILSSSEY
jgi:muramoyltetrapeptide carboxypeptidase